MVQAAVMGGGAFAHLEPSCLGPGRRRATVAATARRPSWTPRPEAEHIVLRATTNQTYMRLHLNTCLHPTSLVLSTVPARPRGRRAQGGGSPSCDVNGTGCACGSCLWASSLERLDVVVVALGGDRGPDDEQPPTPSVPRRRSGPPRGKPNEHQQSSTSVAATMDGAVEKTTTKRRPPACEASPEKAEGKEEHGLARVYN